MFRSRKSSESNITVEKDKGVESNKNRSSLSQTNIKRSSHKSQEAIPVTKAQSGESLIFGDAIFKTKKPVAEYFRTNIDETKKAIARDQDLDSLLTLLQFEQMEIRYLASEIIQGLSVNEEGLKLSESAWSSLGLLARNVDDSMEHSDTILTEVSWTLLTLASHPECHKDFITFIEWSTLLRLTNCDHVIIKSNVCSLLGYLALNDEFSPIVAKNFLDLLIFSGKVTSHIEVKETVSSTLANLSLNEDNARKICDKAIDMLVLWLMDPNEVKLAVGAVNTITNIILVGDEKRNRLFVERNGLFPLTKLLHVNNVDILKTATFAISVLASHHDLHNKFISLGVVDILISLAKSPSLDESILMGVCLAIHNLVENIDSRREMLRSVNLVDLLFELMKRRSSEQIEQQANKTILLLSSSEPKYPSSRSSRESDMTITSSDESSQDEIESPLPNSSSSSFTNSEPSLSRSGSFGPLANAGVYWRVKRPSSLPGSLSDMNKSGSFSRISDISEISSDSLYPGILSELVSSLEANADVISTFIKREHVAKLKQLARLNVSRQVQYANHGAYDVIPSLVLLLFCSDEKIKSLALDAVTLFADSNEANQTRVLNSQGLKIIQDLVFVGNVGNPDYISMKAIGALASLSTNNKKVSKEIRDAGVVTKLIDLLRNTNVATQKNAIIALCAFADTDSETQMYIIKNGGVPILTSLLNDSNSEVVTLATSAITAIVKYNVKGQNLMMGTKGYFATMVGLLDSKEVEVQSQACALIMEICRENEKCQKMFWEEKVADPLLNILQTLEINKGDLIYNAAGAVWVLSGKKKRRKYFIERGGLVALQTLHKKLGPTNQKSSVVKAVDQTISLLSKDKKKSFMKM